MELWVWCLLSWYGCTSTVELYGWIGIVFFIALMFLHIECLVIDQQPQFMVQALLSIRSWCISARSYRFFWRSGYTLFVLDELIWSLWGYMWFNGLVTHSLALDDPIGYLGSYQYFKVQATHSLAFDSSVLDHSSYSYSLYRSGIFGFVWFFI